ncbi:MAG: winged helix-turn-helix transcriptional regulator [Nitrososphaerota archaeon]|jgi:DNA-binding HxlR family transcriptional regulator|nr:winged helix-turn-helix transcriptional regulator [Nitrososphaerota archaeon]
MSAPPFDDSDSSKSELFDALSHPIRVRILESLESGSKRFSDLKKATGIQSNGHLQFHLSKLQGLVSITEDGNYSLTDDGREAIRFLRISRMPEFGSNPITPNVSRVKNVAGAAIVIALLLVGSIIVVAGMYLASQTAWQQGVTSSFAGSNLANSSRIIPAGGVFIAGGVTESSPPVYRIIAQWSTPNPPYQLVFAVIGVPKGMNWTTVMQNHSSALFLASSDNPGGFADLTFSIPPNDFAIGFVWINPSQSPVTLSLATIDEEIAYHPFAQMGRDLTYLGYAFLALAIVILGAFYLRPFLARHNPKGRTDSSVEDITRGR